jgi:hypothetical protein
MPNERHGDDRHITMQDVEQAAQANGKPVAETWQTMQRTMANATPETAPDRSAVAGTAP